MRGPRIKVCFFVPFIIFVKNALQIKSLKNSAEANSNGSLTTKHSAILATHMNLTIFYDEAVYNN